MDELIKHNIKLQDYCSFKIGGSAANFAHIHTREQLVEASDWSAERGLPIFILGEGSNLIFGEDNLKLLIMKIEIPGYEVIDDDADGTTIKIGAGEHWDGVVGRTVEQGLSGIEAMSMIPGTAGATPVQNVGAYGQEIKDTLVELEAYDTQSQGFVVLSNADCGFSYRDSIFKSKERERYIICSITLKLSKGVPAAPTYASLKTYLEEHEVTNPTVAQIREAVMSIRASKLPDPSVVPNVGSFFKNPIVEQGMAEVLKQSHPDMPVFPAADGEAKIAAGWLIEQCGLKGKTLDHIQVYDKNALVLTNPDGANFHDLQQAVEEIKAAVKAKFGIELEQEPQVVQ